MAKATDQTPATDFIEKLAQLGQVRLLTLKAGDRVRIEYEGVTAFGTVAPMGYHWSGMNGINNWPIVLDGTEQMVTVHAQYVTKEGAK